MQVDSRLVITCPIKAYLVELTRYAVIGAQSEVVPLHEVFTNERLATTPPHGGDRVVLGLVDIHETAPYSA